jgi:hypothetical protein
VNLAEKWGGKDKHKSAHGKQNLFAAVAHDSVSVGFT